MSTTWEYNDLENKHNLYCGKYCMKNLSESLKDHMKNITDFEKKKMLLLTEERKSHQDTKVGYICGKKILKKFPKSINYWKVRGHCHYTGKYRGAAHRICNLKFNVHD